MNKKAYIIPSINTVTIGTTQIIASSITGTSGADGLGAGGNSEDEDITSGNTKSNDWDIW
ncbi:MAG: hypothetical protein IJ739_01325 [Bacteroidaceae bacterium]|nr:hypothetical protein [Bacteroidaceae bacterium]